MTRDDQSEGQHHQRHHCGQHRVSQDPRHGEPQRGELGERRGGERKHDEQQERLGEGRRLDRGGRFGPGEKPEEHGQEQHLAEHEQGRRREQAVLRPAGESREHDHVVDAGRQQHEQHADQQRPIVRDESAQPEHHEWHDDEVHHEDRAEEAVIAQRCGDAPERHTEEGRVQQYTEHRQDERTQCGAARRRQDPHEGAERDRREVQRHLMPLRPGRDPLHDTSLPGRGAAARNRRAGRAAQVRIIPIPD